VGGDCDGDCALAPEPRSGLGATIGRKGIAEGRASMGRDGMAWPTMARAGGAEWARRSGQRSSHSRLGAEGGGSGRGSRSEEQDASCILHPASSSCRLSFRDLTAARRAWWARKPSRVHPLPLAACCPMRRFSRDEQADCLGAAAMHHNCTTTAPRQPRGASTAQPVWQDPARQQRRQA
jgi:hypothetical protein